MSVFSERLTALLRDKGISQKVFAAKANVTESSMSYYINGSRTPSGQVLSRIAKALDTTTDYLLGNTDNPTVLEGQERLKKLQQNLCKLDDEQLKKVQEILKILFNDIFEDNN